MNTNVIGAEEKRNFGPMASVLQKISDRNRRIVINVTLAILAICVIGVLVWQGLTAAGNPDPTVGHLSRFAMVMDTGILVFREGLEAILVLAALTASLVRTGKGYWKPIGIGAGFSF